MSKRLDGWKWNRSSTTGYIAHKPAPVPLWYRVLTGVVGMKPEPNIEPMPFWAVKLPTGWSSIIFRVMHSCKAQSVGVFGWQVSEQCRCGGVRFAELDPISYMRGSDPTGVAYKPGPWQNRNTRFTGDGMNYLQGQIRPISTKGGE